MGHQDTVTCCAALGIGCIISGGGDGSLRIWDCDTSESVRILSGHRLEVSCVAVQADGTVVSGSLDGTLRVHDAASAEVLRTFAAHTEGIVAMCVAGVKCASSDGKTLLLWETATGRSKRLDGHRAAVTCLQCLGEERVVSASSDETVRVWMTSTGACLRVVQSLGEAPCSLSVLGNGNLVVGLETARSLSVLDADSYDVLRILHDGLLDPSTVCALDDDRVIAASLDDTVLRLWNTSVEVDVDRDAHSA